MNGNIKRNSIFVLALSVVAGLALHAPVYAYAQVWSVESMALTVSDMDQAIAFYSEVLDFEKVSDREVAGGDYERLQGVSDLKLRVVRMALGDEVIDLMEFISPKGRSAPRDAKSNDRWFQHIAIIVSDMDQAYARLKSHGVEHVSPEPQTLPDWNPNAAGIKAFYFKDPDGHPLEILEFPEGKGASKWHEETDKLFLGIDHTAIVVWDTAESLSFYRDLLGFQVAGESTNYGAEQEKLNNVPRAKLHISSLKVRSGPAIEFLEYLYPRDGNPYPQDAKSNDSIHWQTTLVVDDLGPLADRLRERGTVFVSSDIVTMPKESNFQNALMVRDPDGHVMKLVEERVPGT